MYLTAIMLLAEEGRFLQIIGIRRGELQILRDITTRPNIQYSVVEFKKEEEDEIMRELV